MSREIDKLIAEHVMGLVLHPDESEIIPASMSHMLSQHCPSYSTDIRAAWEVVEKLEPVNFKLEQRGTDQTTWFCRMYTVEGVGYHQAVETAPMALCLAALKAKGIDIPKQSSQG